ncbi:MAG: YbaB/EbfC family nucleoid-associated protein [Deltaproteobacteria bacterium]|jgi:DNA-binding YbaB/EbfC family protein|nr:YbaB/EbfC family nucleoid-associated protein [Deltaproteobacteria bacterium]
MSEESHPPIDQENLIQQAKMIRDQVLKAQETFHKKTATATAGGGMVTATVNGLNRLESIKIDPEVINPNDPDMLGDLVVAAVNEAMSQIQQLILKETSDITSHLSAKFF